MAESRKSQEIAVTENIGESLPDEMLAGIQTFEDAFAAMEERGMTVEDIADFGTGFVVLRSEEKSRLIGVPFLIVEWRFSQGDMGKFVSAAIVTRNNEKLVINDGSTGIRDQLMKITMRRREAGREEPQKGLFVERGLRVSEYDYPDEKTGELRKARTYYLAN